MSPVDRDFQEAVQAINRGRPLEAERLFQRVLKNQPKNVAALNLLTVVLMSIGRYAEAERFISRAVEINQSSDVSYYNYGLICKILNKPHLALKQFDSALRLNAKAPETWNNRGTVFNDLRLHENAIADFNQAISLAANYSEAIFNKGKSLGSLKRYDEAFEAYEKALAIKPDLAEAWLARGNLYCDLKLYDEALADFAKALAIKPGLAEAWLGRGNVFCQLERFDEAFAAYDKALAIKPGLGEASLGRGNVFTETKRYDEAFAEYDKALAVAPDLAKAWLGRGNVFTEMKRYDEAFAAYDKALALEPDLAEAWLGRGQVFTELKRCEEAFAAYDRALAIRPDLAAAWLGRGNMFTELKHYDDAFAAYDKALALRPGLAEAWLGRGNVFCRLERFEEAFAAYEKALAIKPDRGEALLGRGNVLAEIKRYDEAFAEYDKALAITPDLAEAWLGRGNVFTELKRYEEAFAAYDTALAIKPALAEAWLGYGNVFTALKRYEEAFAAYDKVLAINPDLGSVEGSRLHSKMQFCNWERFESECGHLVGSVRNKKQNSDPFVFLSINSSAEDQYNCASLWVNKKYPPARLPLWKGEIYKHNKIRVAYLSADFHEHATAYLMAGVFENHDRSKFDITAISIGPNDNSPMRQRLERSFGEFIDARMLSDAEVATQIRAVEVDILVDLKGFTQDARTNILARRPAPIQVNYLGYPGTMGADYIDYIIADPVIIPLSQKSSYSEKMVYLPNSYQANDCRRNVSEKMFTREECGIPNGHFVFCCFNNNYKITPAIFDCWMRILTKVPSSVLWLLEDSATAAANLKREAELRGVGAERLIFAKRMPLRDHLARHRSADLFLDTQPYNAHTTASDALWAGLPVLTQLGETFAGRVAASLLNAIGLPELIAKTAEEYEGMAVDLATHTEKLTALKRKLMENRLTTSLFDTKRFTRHIEAAYTAMHDRYRAGMVPDHIVVPN